jgi:hypothetical protein
VQVLGMETARDWTWPLPFKRNAMFWLSLQETAGQAVTLDAPALTALTRTKAGQQSPA